MSLFSWAEGSGRGKVKILFQYGEKCNFWLFRPVGAIFDVDVREVDEKRREEVFHSIVTRTGPPDATVLVSVSSRRPGQGFPPELMDGVLQKASELGVQVLLVKFVGDDMWLIFNDGEMALSALSMDDIKVSDKIIYFRSTYKADHFTEAVNGIPCFPSLN